MLKINPQSTDLIYQRSMLNLEVKTQKNGTKNNTWLGCVCVCVKKKTKHKIQRKLKQKKTKKNKKVC